MPAQGKAMMIALEGPCMVQPCVCTAGYNMREGQWICWLHALELGWTEYLEQIQVPIVFVASRTDEQTANLKVVEPPINPEGSDAS
jgi:hypothetical protein